MTRPALLAALASVLAGAGPLAAQPAPALPRLAGTVVGPAERFALFAGLDGTVIAAAEGERIGAYTVAAISAGHVQLQGAAGTHLLSPVPDPALRSALALQRPPAPLSDADRQADADNNK